MRPFAGACRVVTVIRSAADGHKVPETRSNAVRRKLRRIANEAAELPLLRQLARPLYRRMFQRPYRNGNAYFGRYDSHAAALRDAPRTLPSSYDQPDAAGMYRDRHGRIRVSDYPAVFWMSRLLTGGQRRIFDLGGHIGVSYYGFRGHIGYPDDLEWTVHDTPSVMDAGRVWAREHDAGGRLRFADSATDADGHDVLFSSGTLQYLDYGIADLLRTLAAPPAHVLVNLVPMHSAHGYYTLQNIGRAVLPYHVAALALRARGNGGAGLSRSRPVVLRRAFTAGAVRAGLRDRRLHRPLFRTWLTGELTKKSACPAADRSVFTGAPGEIRTPDPQVRSLVLYPTELRARKPTIVPRHRQFRQRPDGLEPGGE